MWLRSSLLKIDREKTGKRPHESGLGVAERPSVLRDVFRKSQLAADKTAETVGNLGMAGDSGLFPGRGIPVNVMFGTVPDENTSFFFQFPNEGAPVHAVSTRVFLRDPSGRERIRL